MSSVSVFMDKRNQLEILAEVLELCRKPTTKTRMMCKTNMSYSGLQKFMKHLQRLELLRLAEDAEKYVTTEKGLELFRRYAGLQDLLR